MKKRIFLIILDSFGIGAAPDADAFGDASANTLLSRTKTEKLSVPNLEALGLGLIEGVTGVLRTDSPLASYGRMQEVSRGKDTTVGHWELAGLISHAPLPTYENGFPDEVIREFERVTGCGVICNMPYSGTEVIRDFAEEHLKTGKLIVYTSADSVFQIAAHEDIVPPERLYEYCLAARKILSGKHAVGRVIARPFVGSVGNFTRTANRRDFSLAPHGKTVLDALKADGLDVIGVGKISDIFAGVGLTESIKTHSNEEGMQVAIRLAKRDFSGLAFINLVDFDSKYGHRQDADGYALALSDFDKALGDLLKLIKSDDLLIITADHGCDPSDLSTDHTREYVPLLIYGDGVEKLGTLHGFYNVANIISQRLGVDFTPII